MFAAGLQQRPPLRKRAASTLKLQRTSFNCLPWTRHILCSANYSKPKQRLPCEAWLAQCAPKSARSCHSPVVARNECHCAPCTVEKPHRGKRTESERERERKRPPFRISNEQSPPRPSVLKCRPRRIVDATTCVIHHQRNSIDRTSLVKGIRLGGSQSCECMCEAATMMTTPLQSSVTAARVSANFWWRRLSGARFPPRSRQDRSTSGLGEAPPLRCCQDRLRGSWLAPPPKPAFLVNGFCFGIKPTSIRSSTSQPLWSWQSRTLNSGRSSV